MEVGLDAQTVHLDQHLGHEQSEEDKLCIDWREGGRRGGKTGLNTEEGGKKKMKESEVEEKAREERRGEENQRERKYRESERERVR